MKNKIKKITISAIISSVLGVASSAIATPVFIEYSGTWNASGKSFTGEMQYDSNHIDGNTVQSDIGSYNPTYLSIVTEGWNAFSSTARISVLDDYLGMDQFSSKMTTTSTFFSTAPFEVWLSIIDNKKSIFSSDALPTSSFFSNSLDKKALTVLYGSGLSLSLQGTINSLTLTTQPSPVPEPSSILLMATGLAAFSTFRKKRHIKA